MMRSEPMIVPIILRDDWVISLAMVMVVTMILVML